MNVNEEMEKLKQQVAELRQQDQALRYAYRVLVRTLAEQRPYDMPYLQSRLRNAAQELGHSVNIAPQVPAAMTALADDVMIDHYAMKGRTAEQAQAHFQQIQKDCEDEDRNP